jgi:hypothetical protein
VGQAVARQRPEQLAMAATAAMAAMPGPEAQVGLATTAHPPAKAAQTAAMVEKLVAAVKAASVDPAPATAAMRAMAATAPMVARAATAARVQLEQ